MTFSGRVRADAGLTALTLEHYPGMTEREIAAMSTRQSGAGRFWGSRSSIAWGELEPGARIVLVATASSHRQAAFAAAEFLMDYLKTHAPFWKEEERGDSKSWVAAKDSDEDAVRRWR